MPNEETRALMQSLAEGIDQILNGDGERVNGFVLMVFPMESPEGLRQVNHVSNIHRDDKVVMMTEMLARLKGQPEMVGHA